MVPVNFQRVRVAQQPRKLGLASRYEFIPSYAFHSKLRISFHFYLRISFQATHFTPSYKVSIFIIEYLVAHQFSGFFSFTKSYSVVLEFFSIKELATSIDRTLNLICSVFTRAGADLVTTITS